jgi:exo-beta-1,3-glucanase (GH17 family)
MMIYLRLFRSIPLLLFLSFAAKVQAKKAILSGELRQPPKDLLSGFKRGVCYSGFRRDQHPDTGSGSVNPTDDQILEDLGLIKGQGGFGLIRLYDSQPVSESVLRLIQSHHPDLRVLLGSWLGAEMLNPNYPWQTNFLTPAAIAVNRKHNQQEIQSLIRLAKQYGKIVVAVSVGNETQVDWNDHMVPETALIQYVRQVKKVVHQPVTVADNYNWWANHGGNLAKELDFISVHTYPLWENKGIEEGLGFTIANLQAVRKALPGSRIVITEAGWASYSNEFGSRAGEAQQRLYYDEVLAWAERVNITTFFFEAFDEPWKGDSSNALGAEKHWGLWTVDRQPKAVLKR